MKGINPVPLLANKWKSEALLNGSSRHSQGPPRPRLRSVTDSYHTLAFVCSRRRKMLLNLSYSWPTINCGHSGHAIFAYRVGSLIIPSPPLVLLRLHLGLSLI